MRAQETNPYPAQYSARPGANPPFKVAIVMFIFGNDSAPLFQEDSQAKKVASELFDDDFVSCMDKNVKELDDNLNSYSLLTAANSQIRLNMVQKKNVKAFIQ